MNRDERFAKQKKETRTQRVDKVGQKLARGVRNDYKRKCALIKAEDAWCAHY